MQKYYITDGNRYIKKRRCSYLTCTSPVMADQFALREAQRILDNNLTKDWQRQFYLEGVKDFSKITREDIQENTTAMAATDSTFTFDDSILGDIEHSVRNILDTQFIPIQKLIGMKKDLEDAQQYYDRVCSDIRHWILDHKPPAHVMAKVYVIQHGIEKSRARIKEDLGFVVTLVNAREQSYTYEKLQEELRSREYKEYSPNTKVYKELDKLTKTQ